MRRRLKPLPELRGDQAAAVDPRWHASLSASAGSGKTQVLTARVLRLLLQGVHPETILCLTFTKAGAAEMANRIGDRLAAWVRMKESELGTDLANLGESNDPPMRERARRLFAKVLEAPGGLRIQTIHSFAQALLASFPAEAGIAPGFKPIEGRAEQELARSTLATLLAEAETSGRDSLLEDVQRLSLRLGEDGAIDYLMRCARAPESMTAFGDPAAVEPLIRRIMDLPEESAEDYLAHHCHDDRFDCDLLRAIANANRRWGTSTGRKIVEQVESWLSLSNQDRSALLPELALIVFTKTGELKKVQTGQRNADPDYDRQAERLARAIGSLLDVQNGARLASEMAAGIRAGQAFAAAYTRAKRSLGVADFNDLIAWTRTLLSQPGMGDWVRYKLDRRTDHILVDESQDTNRQQWEIVEALAAEFYSGSSESERRHRTLFMVGDFKQAIYRFQGTDPEEFRRAVEQASGKAEALRASALEAEEDWIPPEFKQLSIASSFRSAPAILDLVDQVIDQVGHRNFGLDAPPDRHRAHFADRPGEVLLWTPFATQAGDDSGEEGWLGEDVRNYAGEIAREVRRWTEAKPVLASTGRPLTAGDILILVRSRGELASLLVARLFSEGVPVAGIDRLHLQKPLAVRDLLAAIGFAVQPLDDLNLANLIVSPLVGWNQDQLRELAMGRSGSLWSALIARSNEGPRYEEARALLNSLLAMADFTTPHRFLETILSGPIGGRRKLYSRLGLAARDPIDELLSSALEFERDQVASLDRFVAWFAKGEVEIKRDPSAPMDAVRVMTVHGAKGLEAPVVLLADATADPSRQGGPARSMQFPIRDVGNAPLLRPRKAERMSPFAEIIARDEQGELEEHWRLLYVALTRAAEKLVVAGLDTSNSAGVLPENCWFTKVEQALQALGANGSPGPWGEALQYRGGVPQRRISPKPPARPPSAPIIPAWATEAAPPEARPPRPLAPSAIAEDREPSPPPSVEQRAAARRGTLIHQLFERLADVEIEDRIAAAGQWLERSAGISDAGERRQLTDLVCSILDHPEFAALFGPGSLAEAPLAATLEDGRVIAGTVDRLLVEDEQVSVIDFKTGRVPASERDIPASHRAQMAAYADALRIIFPGRAIRAALLYTAAPLLFEVVP